MRMFGKIVDGKMVLNDIGRIVQDELSKSFEMRNELFLGDFVVMPNHLHAIAILYNNHCNDKIDVETHAVRLYRRPKSISSFVAGFKSSTTRRINDWIGDNKIQMAIFDKANPFWQANYFDHIIRDNNEFRSIADYIVNNPVNWEQDTLMCE